MAGGEPTTRLYLITPPCIDPVPFSETLASALEGGDVACLQLRLKDVDEAAIRDAAEILKPVCHGFDVALIINDDPELTAAIDADGVHVGQEDTPYSDARKIVGDDRIVGVTCHDSRHLAMEAAEAGADYVAFGAFFPTDTKEPKTTASVELIEWWAPIMEVPCVAIGGITVENCVPLIEAGADFLAVSAGVWGYEAGPKAAVGAFNELFDRHAPAPPL